MVLQLHVFQTSFLRTKVFVQGTSFTFLFFIAVAFNIDVFDTICFFFCTEIPIRLRHK